MWKLDPCRRSAAPPWFAPAQWHLSVSHLPPTSWSPSGHRSQAGALAPWGWGCLLGEEMNNEVLREGKHPAAGEADPTPPGMEEWGQRRVWTAVGGMGRHAVRLDPRAGPGEFPSSSDLTSPRASLRLHPSFLSCIQAMQR